MHTIKVIADGLTKRDRFMRRWGVSFLIDEDVLFDTFGDPGVFLRHVRRFYVDLSKIRHIVLSHDHWDHVSGLWDILERHRNVTVYVCPHGEPGIKSRIASYGVSVVEASPFTQIKDGIFSTGEIPATFGESRIFEQSLVIKFLKKLTLLTGCAHPGVIRIVDTVNRRFSRERILAVIGGLHLRDVSPAQARNVVLALRSRGVAEVSPMHCTGRAATRLFAREFGPHFFRLREGDTAEA